MTPQDQQRLSALDIANKIRVENAQYKKQLKATKSRDTATRMLALRLCEKPTGAFAALDVYVALKSIPVVGDQKVKKALNHVGVFSTRRKVRDLTERQREALAVYMEQEWCGKPSRRRA